MNSKESTEVVFQDLYSVGAEVEGSYFTLVRQKFDSWPKGEDTKDKTIGQVFPPPPPPPPECRGQQYIVYGLCKDERHATHEA